MNTLEELLYSPLEEEENARIEGWEKDTVEYATNNKSRVIKQIRNLASGKYKKGLQTQDVEDIYSELMLYLYKHEDYDLVKAVNRASSSNIVSLEGYVNVCIKFCTLRFLTDMINNERELVHETISKEDNDISIWDAIADTRSEINIENMDVNLEEFCSSCEPMRYRFGPDLYLVMYVRLITPRIDGDRVYTSLLNAIGISKNSIAKLNNNSEDAVIANFAKAISLTEPKEAIRILEKYVYGASAIRKVVAANIL